MKEYTTMNLKLNDNYNNLKESYLFSDIAKRVKAYREANPDKKIISLGIGDVTLPLTPCVVEAMQKAVEEMGKKETFRGYAPDYGYDFIRQAVASYYGNFGVNLSPEEVFVSDGAKSDVGNIAELFGDNRVLIPDPVYPVYLDSNIMQGRRVQFLSANADNGFLPMPDGLTDEASVIYLCSPNNPTGAVYNREQLKAWVDFAQRSGSVIIFDSAYEAYIKGDYPHSIFEIQGADRCAIEICSLSKTAGFTGTRCAWTVIRNSLVINGVSLAKRWARRQATKFNGVPYVIQRAGEAALSVQGQKESAQSVAYYMENAALLAKLFQDKGIWFTGGVSSPYIWLRCPNGMASWDFFDFLLKNAQIVGTPGSGFGQNGEGYFRLTSFGSHEATREAVDRLYQLL
jgi:LL-diaminopimelate aminotransferase